MGMNSADAVSLRISTDTEQTSSNLDKVIQRLDKTVELLSKISSSDSFKKENQNIKNSQTATEDLNNSLNKVNKTLSSIDKNSSWTGFKSLANTMNTIAKSSYKFIEASAGYAENLNLMQVAFKETGNEIDRINESLVNGLSDSFGLDESVMTRQLGYYRQIGNALSIDAEYADTLAHNLLKMQLDMSSLYNLSFEKSGEVLQSSMAGQTKPIRGATGADITQSTLQMDLDRLNIDASITDLSRAEKVLLIYLSIQNQIVNSQGDLAKTINSTANQQKIFAEQSARLARVIGDVLNPVFGKLLAVVNGVLMVFVELISAFASLVGFELPKYETGTNDIDWVDDLNTGLGSANEKAKSLKKSLRGFDKLNVINTPSSSGGGASGGGGLSGAGIMGDLLGSLNDYDMKMNSLKNKATDIRDKIMEWLGFTKEVDKETGEVSWKFDRITGGTVLGAMAIGGIIYKGAELVLKFLKKIGLIKFDNFKDFAENFKKSFSKESLNAPVSKFTSLKNAVKGVIQAGAGLFIFTDSIRDINENGLGLLNTIGLIAGGLMSFQGIFTTITSLAQLFGVTMTTAMAGATAGISLIITGLAGLIAYISNSAKESESFALQIDKLNEKYKQLDETAKENALTNMAQTTRTVALINELKNLVDENGRVKAGYEERTNYILKYTNEALGTEYELVGNVIKQNGKVIDSYKQIQDETQQIMKLRKAEIILEAYKDKYVELLKDEQEAKAILVDKQLKLNQKQLEYEEYVRRGKDENSSFMKELRNNIEKMTLEVENQKITLDAFRTDIQDYEKLQEMHINGTVEDINKAISNVMKETEIKLKESTTNIKNDYDKKFSNFDANISVGVVEKPQFNNFKNSLNNMKANVKVDANTTEAQKKINNLSSSLATSFKVAINYDKKYSKIDISGVTGHANGGFPEDGWFRASKGELMGKFDDGTSIVANNRQVVDGVRQMLRDGMMDALVMANNSNKNKQTTQVTIIAEDNDLLNGIKFKEKQRERQFGY